MEINLSYDPRHSGQVGRQGVVRGAGVPLPAQVLIVPELRPEQCPRVFRRATPRTLPARTGRRPDGSSAQAIRSRGWSHEESNAGRTPMQLP
jgi:hypothetical protein